MGSPQLTARCPPRHTLPSSPQQGVRENKMEKLVSEDKDGDHSPITIMGKTELA